MNDLSQYNTRAYKKVLAEKSAKAQREQGEVWRAGATYKREQEMAELEERLGVDGVRPSERGMFVPTAVTGTTSYSAFKKADIRAVSNGEYENIE